MKISAAWLIWTAVAIWPVTVLSDSTNRSASIQKIVATLEANDLSAYEIRAIKSFNVINVIDLAAFDSPDESQAIDVALRDTDDGWAMVQTAIVANETIKQELSRHSVAVGKIVAATMDETGTLTIYIR